MRMYKQMAISCWAVAATVWYFRQFSPVIAPFVQRVLRHVWH